MVTQSDPNSDAGRALRQALVDDIVREVEGRLFERMQAHERVLSATTDARVRNALRMKTAKVMTGLERNRERIDGLFQKFDNLETRLAELTKSQAELEEHSVLVKNRVDGMWQGLDFTFPASARRAGNAHSRVFDRLENKYSKRAEVTKILEGSISKLKQKLNAHSTLTAKVCLSYSYQLCVV
jgi:chromosome segregation ATPase